MRPARLACAALTATALTAAAGCSGSSGPSATGASSSASSSGSSPGSTASPGGHARPFAVHAVRERWALPAALSREAVVPSNGRLLVLGGLTTSDTTTAAVETLDPATGAVHRAGALAQPVHDAAAATVGGAAVVFGGGAQATVDTVQRYQGGHASVAGRLPDRRSDLTAVTSGPTTYLVGGYDGSQPLSAVLATTDGSTFRTIARLPHPVRYAAAAVSGHDLWVFGGTNGTTPTDAIQRVDLHTGAATVAGRLPAALSDAVAVRVGGAILLAGGKGTSGVSRAVYRFTPTSHRVTSVATLPVGVADAGAAVVGHTAYLLGGETPDRTRVVQALTVTGSAAAATAASSPSAAGTASASSTAQAGGAPFTGRLLIADRGNNRLLLVDAGKHLLWHFPNAHAPAPPTGFYFPDDAFFVHHGTGIISNQEGNDTIVEVSFPGGKPLWSYGHPHVPSGAIGYLHEPDDAYLLKDGDVVVADANNCRVVIIGADARQVGQIGTTGDCAHHPPHALGYPNGDTPLADGNLLISEVDGSWISEYTLHGKLVWTTQLPMVSYPSDPQQIGPDRYLVADYAHPGGLYEFDRAGHVVWSYHPASGSGMLDHPSLAEVLPSGLICVNDDYRERVVLIDPRTKRIVWQYGHTGRKGTAPGYLNTPDGFDLLAPDGTTPTHPTTG